jgi:hypothetical protein
MPDAFLGPKDLPALHLDGHLGQGPPRWPGDDGGPVRRVEDGAVTGASELPVLVGDLALLVRADSRVGDEVPAVQVHEHRRAPRLLELDSRPRGHPGGLGYRPPAGAPRPVRATSAASPIRPSVPGSSPLGPSSPGLTAGAATTAGATTGFAAAGCEYRGARGAHAEGGPEAYEPLASDPLFHDAPFVGYEQHSLIRTRRGRGCPSHKGYRAYT